MAESTTRYPSSPAARAFFEALEVNPASQSVNTSSSFIKKRISTLGWRNRFSQDDSYPLTVDSCHFSVAQFQRGEIEGTYGTGATVWPAAIVLIKYMERHRDLIEGKVVVDLGSGTGITSIAAAIMGANHVVCTDGEMNVVRLAQDNIQNVVKQMGMQSGRNEASSQPVRSGGYQINGCPINVQKYWWGLDRLAEDTPAVDVVIVADCVLPKLYPIAPLINAIDQLLASPGAFALVSYEHRHYADYDPRDKIRELAAEKNLTVTTVPMDEQDPVYSVEDIEIWRVERCVN